MASNWIQTHKNIRFDFNNLTEEQVIITDIAHSLSMICRFNGHCDKFYSVAEHCVLGSHAEELETYEQKLCFLLHDASEAYLGDITAPLKALLPEYSKIEKEVQDLILNKFGMLPYYEVDLIKKVDLRMLQTERIKLFNKPIEWELLIGVEPYKYPRIRCFSQAMIKNIFLERFFELYNNSTKAFF